jgi:hypothetical protein
MNTQQAALQAATALVTLMATFEALSDQVDAYVKGYDQNVWDTYWGAMPTVAVNPDGSPGPADAEPVDTHPINLPAEAPLLVCRNDLINGVSMLGAFRTFMAQAGGTLALAEQANVKTAALITG